MTILEENPTPTNESTKIDSSALLAAVPHLRAFARLLRGDPAHADDLVQEVIVHARARIRHFLPENDLKLWLFSLAHSLHHRDLQKSGPRQDARAGTGAHEVPGMSCPDACCASHGFDLAFRQLLDEEREALILIEAARLTYAEAASVCNCPTDTIRSRVSRARGKLQQALLDNAA